jgi:RHS repeat-associated protein
MKKPLKHLSSLLACALVLASTALCAQEISIYQEQGKLIRAPKAIGTLGADLFGDKVNFYSGTLEFLQTDVSLPGNNSLAVSVGRRLTTNGSFDGRKQFGSWEMEIPHMHGVFAKSIGWQAGGPSNQRCTNFTAPPGTAGSSGSNSTWSGSEYWHGNFLYVPGAGDQEVLTRGSNTLSTEKLITHDLWTLRCGVNIQSPSIFGRELGEGFIATSPDGTQYRFDWLVSRDMDSLTKPDAGPQALAATKGTIGGTTPTPQAVGGNVLARQEVWILPTLVTDRFGNTVTYTYDTTDKWKVLTITSSDGRTLTFTYVSGTHLVQTVSDGTRTWTYSYQNSALTGVALPDGSSWQLANLFPLINNVNVIAGGTCEAPDNISTTPLSGSLTHPSGAVGTFTLVGTLMGRSHVYQYCAGDTLTNTWSYALYPRYFENNALVKKSISGPGMATSEWNYHYGADNASWDSCGSCTDRKVVWADEPDGYVTRYTFGNRFQVNEGQLLMTESGLPGGTGETGGTPLRATTTTYHAGTDGPYPNPIGASAQTRGDSTLGSQFTPLSTRVISQQGETFSLSVTPDYYGSPSVTTRSSSLGSSRTETTTYSTLLPRLRQVATVTAADGTVMVSNSYLSPSGNLGTSSRFGHLEQTLTYNTDGTLATRKDGNNFVTTYTNYKRGLAQNVAYPNTTSESAVVNNLGLIDSTTDGAGFTTSYAYDAMGRLKTLTPPTADTVVWNATTLPFVAVAGDEYGIGSGHWRQTISTGNGVTVNYYDAQWRPIVTRTYDTGDAANTSKFVVRRYDFRGNLVFESYPQRAISTITDTLDGLTYSYDALGRVTRTVADSEQGDLTTNIYYEAGFTKKVANPRGYDAVFHFMAYDEPNEQWIVSRSEIYGMNTVIARDQFGKPVSVTQSDASASATRSYVYDVNARLCKTIEPEIGATVLNYDAANNVSWRAIGVNLPSTTSCDQASVTAAKKITYGYDQRNWLKTTTYGDASPSISRTYFGDGIPQTVSSNGTVWTYTYNKRRLLEGESLAYAGKTYNIGRTYDANGSLATLSYPGASALSVNYTPNALGQPKQVSGYASAITYFPNDAIAGFTYGNGIVHAMAQNTRGLPWRVNDIGVLFDEYTYDENGNVTGITDIEQGITTRTMTYDAVDRLKTATANGTGMWGTATYSVDGLGNMREVTVTSGANARHTLLNYDATNRVTSISGSSALNFGYDSQGNLSTRGSAGYVFDQGNRLSSATGKASYLYDGWGHRVKEAKVDGTNVIQVYSRDGQLLYGSSAVGAATPTETRYIYLKGHLLAEAGGNFVHTDGLGSPVARTNAAKSVLSRTRYEPYGLTATGTVPTTIGFTGHVNDADTGLVYMQQRYYDPVAARFMSTDPVLAYADNVQGLNRYSYANNNPYKYVDPDGRETEKNEPDKRQQQLDEQRRRARANCIINCEFISTTREKSSYDPNDVRGGFDSRGYSTVYAPGSYNPDEAGLLLLTMASMVIAPETALFKFFPEIGIVFKTEHYAARLEKAGLDARMVEGLVKRDVSSFSRFLGPGAGFGGSLTVNGSLLRFTGKLLPSDIISIGTIYKVIPK